MSEKIKTTKIKSHRDLSKDCSFLYIRNVTINKLSLICQLTSHLFIKAYIVFILNMEILYHCDYHLNLTLTFWKLPFTVKWYTRQRRYNRTYYTGPSLNKHILTRDSWCFVQNSTYFIINICYIKIFCSRHF